MCGVEGQSAEVTLAATEGIAAVPPKRLRPAGAVGRRKRHSSTAAQQHCSTAAASMLRDSETEAQLRLVEGSLVRR